MGLRLWSHFDNLTQPRPIVCEYHVRRCNLLGAPPTALDTGLSMPQRDRVVRNWSRSWTLVTNPAPAKSSELLFGQWVRTDPSNRVSVLDFHRNGRLDVHLVDSHVWYCTYAFWARSSTQAPVLCVSPWETRGAVLAQPDDMQLFRKVSIDQNEGGRWFLHCAEEFGPDVSFERMEN
jgi:hypothetical protein